MDNIFNLEKKFADEMIAHARSETPNECCGILVGVKGRVLKLYRTTNAEHSPFRYTVDSRELVTIYREIGENGWELLAVYHSHPDTDAYPSAIDIESAFLPEFLYFIISLSNPDQAVIRGFRIIEAKIREIELRIIET